VPQKRISATIPHAKTNMIQHLEISGTDLKNKIKRKEICFGGNQKLKIYGTLKCTSGKRMKIENRVFFASEHEALEIGFRPCGHCMKTKYQIGKMNLFNIGTTENINLLPKDGTVNYYGKLISPKEADHYLDCLLNTIEWKNDEAIIFGKHITTKRKVAWYGDSAFEYTYSNTTKRALSWTKELLELKGIAEEKTGVKFNSCLLNLYHNGDQGMAWHSDAEKDLKKNGAIGSLSFGAERKFAFKHKQSKETVSMILGHGSLLVMKDTTQTNWLHRLPPTKLTTKTRVNLTFRTIVCSIAQQTNR